jgi:hypothetical protein
LLTDRGLRRSNTSLVRGSSFTGSALWDSTNDYVRLGTASSSNLELDSSWTPAWSNLVGYWKLDETTWNGTAGQVLDSTTNGNSGNSTTGATLTSGKLGNGGNFSSSYYGVEFTNAGSLTLGSSNLTVGLWVNSTQAAASSQFPFLIDCSAFDITWSHGDYQQLQLSVTIGGSTYTAVNTAGAAINDGNWHYVVGVRNGANLYTYVDGSLQATGTAVASGTFATYTGGYIGAGGGLDQEFNGKVDDVAVWNTALSASAIATIYQHESAKYAGTATSRVMDSLSSGATWTTLSWISTLPFYKELPDANPSPSPTTSPTPESESSISYSSQTSSLMSGNVGLWHLDETSGATVYDRSGTDSQ